MPPVAPFKRISSVLQYYDGYLYMATGKGDRADVADFHRFSLSTLQWEDITHPNIYEPVILSGCGVYEDHLYLFFGWSHNKQDDIPKIFKVKLEGDFEWILVGDNYTDVKRDSFGFSQVADKFYFCLLYTSDAADE